MTYYLEMIVSRVLDRVTSTYAYDFTGEVTHSDHKDLCEFSE
ncbi:hypothetical protein [Enterococcus hirae]|nr:hypothetical protein [Enterococcus hirae]